MFFLISIPVAVGMLLSAIPMKNYDMTDSEHNRMLAELVAKREAARNGAAVESAEEVQAKIEEN